MRPFQEPDPEHTFKPGSTLKAVVDIYRFDGSFRRITMDAIERVEVAIRATISNHMRPKYGPDWIAELRAGLSKGLMQFSPGKKTARFELADWVNLGLAGVLGCILGRWRWSSTSH